MIDWAKTAKAVRLSAGLPQAEAARRAGLSRVAVSNWERGKSTPDLKSLELLLAACGCELKIEKLKGADT